MSSLMIHVLDPNIITSYDMPCCIGEIQIGDFKETFEMPLVYWKIEDYQKQWQEGIERIKTHDQSCLVAELQDPNQEPRAILWVLYKEGDKVYIRNRLLHGKLFSDMLKNEVFTVDTCYDFIKPRVVTPGSTVSEWVIDLNDL